jgi:hypothetical protein
VRRWVMLVPLKRREWEEKRWEQQGRSRGFRCEGVSRKVGWWTADGRDTAGTVVTTRGKVGGTDVGTLLQSYSIPTFQLRYLIGRHRQGSGGGGGSNGGGQYESALQVGDESGFELDESKPRIGGNSHASLYYVCAWPPSRDSSVASRLKDAQVMMA